MISCFSILRDPGVDSWVKRKLKWVSSQEQASEMLLLLGQCLLLLLHICSAHLKILGFRMGVPILHVIQGYFCTV